MFCFVIARQGLSPLFGAYLSPAVVPAFLLCLAPLSNVKYGIWVDRMIYDTCKCMVKEMVI
jgi:hypothetical protein